MDQHLQIVTTADGSNTIYNPQVGENYHSKHGALQESRHVFLTAGLKCFLEQSGQHEAAILEVGFGTGLNFLLTADYCISNNIMLDYFGIEAYPLTDEMINQTSYDQYVEASTWESFISNYQNSIEQQTQLDAYIKLKIDHTQLLSFDSNKKYDVIYFDAFAAIHQPEMWNEEAIAHTIKFLNPGGVFVTYAITGNLKRILKCLGLTIQKIPGAPGKREMLRAIY